MKKYIPFTIAFALFMQTLDSTIISTAIPTIAESLQTTPINLKFALTSYLISLAIFIPISGWFADNFGTKKIFICSLLLFTLGSFFCGIAATLSHLVIARIIQGVGGALMLPVGRLILLKSFPKTELIKVTNYATIPSLIGPALGPVIGGVIVSYVSWRWIFFVNIPFGIAGALLAAKVLTTHIYKQKEKLDFIGFVLFAIGLAGFSFVLSAFNESIISNTILLGVFALSIVFIFTYCVHAHYIKHPFIDISLFKIRTFGATVIGSFFSRGGIGGMSFLLPLFFQLSLDKTAMHSGIILSFYATGMLSIKFFVRPILKLCGFKNLLIVNTFTLGLSVLVFCFITIHSSTVFIILAVFIHGALTSLQFSGMNVLAFLDLNEHNISKGTSLATAIQQLSMSLGISISALILSVLLGATNPFHIDALIFHKTFFIMGMVTMLSSFLFMFLHKHDGNEASGYKIELAEAGVVKR